MAVHNPRPWVTPKEVSEYSERNEVQTRSENRLKVDIMRAEQYVLTYTRNDFSDSAKFPNIPENVRLAIILIAEMYAFRAASSKGTYKSESFDDYSYTLRDTDAAIDDILLGPLLDEYVIGSSKANTVMRLRKV
jgi:hypothetical protein